LKNYHVFRQHLAAPLVAVELSFNGAFELSPGDADVLVQVQGGDIMWQKERLLNIGLRHLPPSCRNVAWLDCDLIFEDDTWMMRASQALETFAIVHLFDERHDLDPDAETEPRPKPHAEPTAFSSIYKLVTGQAAPDQFSRMGVVGALRSTNGLAWAGRRDVLDRHGLYDACIVGAGDKATTCAALGRLDDAIVAHRMNPRRTAHFRSWAGPFSEMVQGAVGYIPGRIFHLWHGDLKHRQYAERPAWLDGFDPFTDIALDRNGCWRWSSNKQDLHARVERYFTSRHEDGYAPV